MLPTPIPTMVEGERGSLYLNTLRDYIRGVLIFPSSGSVPATPAARSGSANGIAPSVVIEAPPDAWLEIFSLFGVNTAGTNSDVIARQCVTITDYITGQRAYMRRPINVTHVFGTQKNPLYLDDPYSEPILIPPNGVLRFDFLNPSSSGAGSFSFAAEGRKINVEAFKDPKLKADVDALFARRRKVSPVWMPLYTDAGSTALNVPGINLASSGIGYSQFITFNNSPAQVMITRIMGSAITAGAAGDTTELFSLDLYDGRTYRKLNTQPITLNTGCGTAGFPFILPTPIVIDSNQVVKATLTNLVTDGATDVMISLQGVSVDD